MLIMKKILSVVGIIGGTFFLLVAAICVEAWFSDPAYAADMEIETANTILRYTDQRDPVLMRCMPYRVRHRSVLRHSVLPPDLLLFHRH